MVSTPVRGARAAGRFLYADPAGRSPLRSASREIPAPLILSRVARSSFLREPEHPIFYAQALLDHWERLGARVAGADVRRFHKMHGLGNDFVIFDAREETPFEVTPTPLAEP